MVSSPLICFLSWPINKPRRVLLLNLEIPPAHFQARIRRMMRALNITPEMLEGRFHVINARGICHHKDHKENGLLVCEQIARSYPAKDVSLGWDDSGYFVASDAEPILMTTEVLIVYGKGIMLLVAQ